GIDGEVVGEPFGARQAESESASARVSVFHGQLDICNPRTPIFEGETKSFANAVGDDLDGYVPAAAMLNGVPGKFAGGGDDFRLIDEAETDLDGPSANRLPRDDDVIGGR